jgi:hypothetical protein
MSMSHDGKGIETAQLRKKNRVLCDRMFSLAYISAEHVRNYRVYASHGRRMPVFVESRRKRMTDELKDHGVINSERRVGQSL